MRAYECGITKEEFVQEIRKQQELDNFIKGTYNGEGEKGCAVDMMNIKIMRHI